jgi:hypothetical protein
MRAGADAAPKLVAWNVIPGRNSTRFSLLLPAAVTGRRVGENALRTAVREFVAHYHGERNHQGIGNMLISPTLVSSIIADRFDAAAASAECSIIMTGPPDKCARSGFWILRHRSDWGRFGSSGTPFVPGRDAGNPDAPGWTAQ